MRKTLTYTGLSIAFLGIVLLFLTARTYTQLGIAAALYPLLAILAIKLLPHKKHVREVSIQVADIEPEPDDIHPEGEVVANPVEVADIDKRAFLKLIGAAGLSFFLFSLLRGKVGNILPGQTAAIGTTSLENSEGKKISPAERQPLDGYQISEIDDDIVTYYGFTNKDGGWLVMREDTQSSSFRYSKGDSDFPRSWANRENLAYDYYSSLF